MDMNLEKLIMHFIVNGNFYLDSMNEDEDPDLLTKMGISLNSYPDLEQSFQSFLMLAPLTDHSPNITRDLHPSSRDTNYQQQQQQRDINRNQVRAGGQDRVDASLHSQNNIPRFAFYLLT